MICAGVDIGSTTTKAVLMRDGRVVGEAIAPSGARPAKTAEEVFAAACRQAGVVQSDAACVIATGYGRKLAGFGNGAITEIKACALGARYAGTPDGPARTIIDVGGQDTKVVSVDAAGEVADFTMNDKCAAGTGRFLEMLAAKLELPYSDFAAAALNSETRIQMNSTCAVFAESEVVSLLARGERKEDIAAAAHNAIADRIAALVRRVSEEEPFMFAGGGARNEALVKAVERALGMKMHVPEKAQFIIAIGAAVEAARRSEK
jgi:predicted CoA-substrate-specific enzyme activase